MFSENRFRYNENLTLMKEEVEVTGEFKSSLWGALPHMAYADSTILIANDETQ